MAAKGPYDGTLQMFVEGGSTVNLHRLAFLRWLAEHGKLEHEVAGPPSGPFLEQRELTDAKAEALAA